VVLEEFLEQLFIGLGCKQFLGDVTQFESRPHVGLIPVDGFHADEVDHAFKFFFGADWQLNWNGVSAEALFDLLNHTQIVRTCAIHLVDENHAWHVVLVALSPDCFRLRFDTTHRTQNGDSAVEHAQAALYFNREVNVARRIDDIDSVLIEMLIHAAPKTGGRSRGNRDAALLLLLHPVHNSRAIVHLANLVRYTGIEKNALSRRRLTGINVRHDADIAIALDGGHACHGSLP